jgi:hypothetical protein
MVVSVAGKFNDLTAHKHTEAELERFKVETKIAIQKFVAMISEPRCALAVLVMA